MSRRRRYGRGNNSSSYRMRKSEFKNFMQTGIGFCVLFALIVVFFVFPMLEHFDQVALISLPIGLVICYAVGKWINEHR